MFKVLVHEEGQEEPKVEVTVPLRMARWALSFMPLVKVELEKHPNIDFEALRTHLTEGFEELEKMEPFDLVKVNDGATRVRVSIV
jgi:hypothetical protein